MEELIEQMCDHEGGTIVTQAVPEERQPLSGGGGRCDAPPTHHTLHTLVPYTRAAARDWWIQTGQSDVPLE